MDPRLRGDDIGADSKGHATDTKPQPNHAIAQVHAAGGRAIMRVIAGFWALVAAVLLAGCETAVEDQAPDYRYRLTVEVETPEGLKAGSSVIEVQQTLGRAGSSPANQAVSRRVRGEAVAVDLPDGQTLYALLRSDFNIDWASYLFVNLVPKSDEPFADSLDNVLELKGEQTLPRMWPPVGHLGERTAYPMLVTFGDEADPTSVAKVDPDNLAATFGKGVKLKRITAELTDDPVTTGIEERLGWLPEYYDKMLDGQRLHTIYTDYRTANDLSQGDFSKRILN